MFLIPNCLSTPIEKYYSKGEFLFYQFMENHNRVIWMICPPMTKSKRKVIFKTTTTKIIPKKRTKKVTAKKKFQLYYRNRKILQLSRVLPFICLATQKMLVRSTIFSFAEDAKNLKQNSIVSNV